MEKKISDKIVNHLRYSKTANGQVGCEVKSPENNSNRAWISISAKKGYDTRVEPVNEYIISYEVEYVELNAEYDEEKNGMDFDLFLVKKECYYNIENLEILEDLLQRWIDDFSVLQPILNVAHPMY